MDRYVVDLGKREAGPSSMPGSVVAIIEPSQARAGQQASLTFMSNPSLSPPFRGRTNCRCQS